MSINTVGLLDLELALARRLRAAAEVGEVAAGSTPGSIRVAGKQYVPDQWVGMILEITSGALRGQWAKIVSNTVDTINVSPAFPVAPAAGDSYLITDFGVETFNVSQVGGVAQTGDDWTIYLRRLDITLSALRDALAGILGRNLAQVGGVPLTGRDIVQDLRQLSERRASSFPTQGSVNVDVASTLILPANPSRVYAAICNDSDTTIYLKIGAPAVVGEGIRLNANGGVYEINWTNLHTLAVYGIHGGTGLKRVTVVEGVV